MRSFDRSGDTRMGLERVLELRNAKEDLDRSEYEEPKFESNGDKVKISRKVLAP